MNWIAQAVAHGEVLKEAKKKQIEVKVKKDKEAFIKQFRGIDRRYFYKLVNDINEYGEQGRLTFLASACREKTKVKVTSNVIDNVARILSEVDSSEPDRGTTYYVSGLSCVIETVIEGSGELRKFATIILTLHRAGGSLYLADFPGIDGDDSSFKSFHDLKSLKKEISKNISIFVSRNTL